MNEQTTNCQLPATTIVATAYDAGYPWGAAFEASARKHHKNVTVFDLVDAENLHPPPAREGHRLMTRPVEAQNGCPQHGAFLEFSDWKSEDVIVFCDGDMIMQRPFSESELAGLCVPEGVFLAGENQPGHHTLEEEANLLRAKVEGWVVDELFPGWRTLPIWNTGMVVARVASWRRLYDAARALLPVGFACFDHYATQQWVISYVIGKWFKHGTLARTIHCHGLAGPIEGMQQDAEGNVYWKGEMAVFRHAINLNPPKAVENLPLIGSGSN